MMRGPDYAHQLTESERRTLELLLRQVVPAGPAADAADLDVATVPDFGTGAGGARSAWRRRLGVLVSAAAVAAIALSGALVALHPGAAPAPPPPVAATTAPSTMDILRALSVASQTRAGTARALSWTSVIVVATPNGGTCAVKVYQAITAVKVATAWPPVSLEIGEIGRPSGATPWLACAEVGSAELAPTPSPTIFRGATNGDGPAEWSGLLKQVRVSALLPDLLDPRAIPAGLPIAGLSADPAALGAVLDKAGALPPGGLTGWWTAVVQLLSSPLCSQAVRSTVLSLAAEADRAAGVTVVADHRTDILGRPGTTLRVPYIVDGVTVQADLTFDMSTGMLLQRTVYAPPGQHWSMVVTASR